MLILVGAASAFMAASRLTGNGRRHPSGEQPAAGPRGRSTPGTAAVGLRTPNAQSGSINVNGIGLPAHARTGRDVTKDGLASGFARNEHGAVLASLHLEARIAPNVGPAIYRPTLTNQCVGSVESALAATEARYDEIEAHVPSRSSSGAGASTTSPIGSPPCDSLSATKTKRE